ncbi:probable protein phosphatase 2C 39 [Typha latifolia]|uniref:probable protein phosphatase 2C 39 n=1 Tax=Typha latifolia TaxID=4733 RepID=UPI003C2CC216
MRSCSSNPQEAMGGFEKLARTTSDLNISFGYQCNSYQSSDTEANCEYKLSTGLEVQDSRILSRSNSFSCLSSAALSANNTLANTSMCNGLLGKKILPGLDSINSFRKYSPIARLDFLSSPSGSSISTDNDILEINRNSWRSMSAPATVESSSFLNSMDVQMAGGPAGEDRVQVVCSEENGWLFCGIYDGFNGRDAADYLAGTLYDNIGFYLYLLECRIKQQKESSGSCEKILLSSTSETVNNELSLGRSEVEDTQNMPSNSLDGEFPSESFQFSVLNCLTSALAQAESDFMSMIEREMDDRPDLVSIGSCVLVVLLHRMDLYVLNLGDSRGVLATTSFSGDSVQAIQLTETHTVDNELEQKKLVSDHPDDPSVIIYNRVKGKLKVTRAFGVVYLKERKFNDALMGILRVPNLRSPPYVSNHPHTLVHRVSGKDLFVVLGSDGLFDFFSNNEVVEIVHQFMEENPFGDPAKHLIEELLLRAAKDAGFSAEELMRIPTGIRREYHDDVTVIVIILGDKQQTSTASTSF